MSPEEPRGDAGLTNTDSQLPVGGAVGGEEPSGAGSQPEGVGDSDRFFEGLAPEQRDAARRASQSATTRARQQIADERRALEMERARLEGQREGSASQPVQVQPGQNPLAMLDERIRVAREAEDMDAYIEAVADKRLVQAAGPIIGGLQEVVQRQAKQIDGLTRQQTETRLQTDPVFQQFGPEINATAQKYGVPLEIARDIIAGQKQLPQVQRQHDELRGEQRTAAASHVQNQVAANLVSPEPTVGGVAAPPPTNQGTGVFDGVMAAAETLPEKALDVTAELVGTRPDVATALADIQNREGE